MDTDTLYACAIAGDSDAVLKMEMKADTVITHNSRTILHMESMYGNTERVRFIVTKFANKNLLVKLDSSEETALHLAADNGHTEVVEVLLDAARRDPVIFEAFVRQVNNKKNTALHLAVRNCDLPIAQLIAKADPSDRHTQNLNGDTPIYLAAKLGYNDILKMICTTCIAPSLDGPDGTTALHAAIIKLPQAQTKKDIDVVMVLIDAAKHSTSRNASNYSFETLFTKTDQNRTALELAVRRNHLDVVKLLCGELPPYQNGAQGSPGRAARNINLKALIYVAAEQGYKDMVKVLCSFYETGNRHGHKDQIAIKASIIARDKESVIHLLSNAPCLVTFADCTRGWTPLHYAANYGFDSVLDVIVQTERGVGYQFVSREKRSPLHVAAEKGNTSTVIRLMQLLPESCVHIDHEGRNILHFAVVKGNKEMIQCIIKYCPQKYLDKLLNERDVNGDTPLHMLARDGCYVPELIKHEKVNRLARNNYDWTPVDMLYFQDQIIGDQIKIKKAFDETQANLPWKFWHRSTEENSNSSQSLVPWDKQSAKDSEFKKAKRQLMNEKLKRMKEELDRYRKRTNTQIIVTALITTVTFTVGFTLPGGYHQSGEKGEGLALLSHKKSFNAFMISDALALALSTTSLFLYFISSLSEDLHQVSKLDAASTVLNIVSVMAMMLTFIAGTYVVLSHSTGLAITVCIICSIFFISIIGTMIKMVYDGKKIRED